MTTLVETPEEAASRLMASKLKDGYETEALHTYTDCEGDPLHWRIRLKHATLDKIIRPIALINGTYELKEPPYPNRKPLYNLHQLAINTDNTVFICEGEKCADALNKLGLLATTSGGADSIRTTNFDNLKTRDVILWRDNDNAGIKWQADLIAILLPLQCKIQWIDVEALNLPAKGDVVDFLASFEITHSRKPAASDIKALLLVESDVSDSLAIGDVSAHRNNNRNTVSLRCAASIQPEPISWLWNGWLAKGKLHIFAGMAGTGKTTVSIALAATITTGGRFPDSSISPVGSVLIWSAEDSISDTLVPRLMAAGADLGKVHFIEETTDNLELRSFDPAIDMQPLMRAALGIPNLALLIIDPIVNAVAGDSHKNGEVRRALQPVVEFGEKLNCAVLGITHFSKGGQGKDPLERVTGSLAFGALARIVLATGKINDGDSTKRIVCRAKSNIGLDTGGFEYELLQKEVKQDLFTSYAMWGKAVEGSAIELLEESANNDFDKNGKSALVGAQDFLIEILADGKLPVKEIQAQSKDAGHSWATVKRAANAIRIIKTKNHDCWLWELSTNINTLLGNPHKKPTCSRCSTNQV